MSALPSSRYGISTSDLRDVARALQIGDTGLLAFTEDLADAKIVEAEDQSESFVGYRVGVPIQPSRAPGQAVFDPTNVTIRNYPPLFIAGVKYWAAGLMLQSGYSETLPNKSEYGSWSLELARGYLGQFMDLPTRANRVRHENPFMPPHLVMPVHKES